MNRWWAGGVLALATLLAGCEVGSETVRNTDFAVGGFYRSTDRSINNGRVVANNTGKAITYFDIVQRGVELEAVDNNGSVFRGQIDQVQYAGGGSNQTAQSANFTLDGATTVGQSVTMSGTFSASGGKSIMNGTWIEPSLYSTVYAVADNAPSSSLTMTPSGSITISSSGTVAFAVSGGLGSYTWNLSNFTIGSLSAASGNSVTYTARAAGTQVVTVDDGITTASATITQQGSTCGGGGCPTNTPASNVVVAVSIGPAK